jgi:hypothetical protein
MMMVNARAAGVVHAICMRRPVARHAVAPRRAATSRAGTGDITPSAWAIGWSNHPSRDLHPQVTSERLPYCILRRMSTDVSQT